MAKPERQNAVLKRHGNPDAIFDGTRPRQRRSRVPKDPQQHFDWLMEQAKENPDDYNLETLQNFGVTKGFLTVEDLVEKPHHNGVSTHGELMFKTEVKV